MSQEQDVYLRKDGFTLIELLLAVTLSAILMTGIVVFVSSSLGSNMNTRKTLEERNKNEHFEQRLTTVLGNINEVYQTWSTFGGGYLTGIFLSTGGPNSPITLLGLKTQTGYCDSYSGSEGETGTVFRLALRQFTSPETENNVPGYTVSMSENSVFSGATRMIGTGYPGNDFDTTSGSLTELSSPSALASSGTHLYIADTMNDRIVSYDMVSGTMAKLLGRENGIEKPTSLSFSGSTLLIASAGNGKIFSLQDGDWDGTTFSSHFRVANNFSANIVRFTFPDIPTIISPSATLDFTFLKGSTSFSNPISDLVNTGSSLQYTFSWGLQTFSTGSPYQININNLSTAPSGSGNHTVTIDFLSGSTPQYSDTFHYFSKWDGSLESSTGNITKTVASGLAYPHRITGAASWSGTINWDTVLGSNPSWLEILSSLPVQDLGFSKAGNVLTIKYHEYTSYDCLLGKHTTEERVVKVLLP